MTYLTSGAARNLPVSGGATATLNGLAFASYDATPTGSIGGGVCGTTSWTTGTQVTCRNGAVTDLYGAAVVTVAAVAGTLVASAFTFDGPPLAVRYIAACHNEFARTPAPLRTSQHHAA